MSTLLANGQPDWSAVPAEAPEEDRMQALIELISAYIEYFHGGAVKMVGYDRGALTISMSGACLDCPLSAETLHGWVEGTVRQFFPELKSVEAV
jgi:Fe-S cluster biogenesis protein NfuA